MKLPVISGIKIIKALKREGFEIDHQTGGHLILRENKEPFRRVTGPNHKGCSRNFTVYTQTSWLEQGRIHEITLKPEIKCVCEGEQENNNQAYF